VDRRCTIEKKLAEKQWKRSKRNMGKCEEEGSSKRKANVNGNTLRPIDSGMMEHQITDKFGSIYMCVQG